MNHTEAMAMCKLIGEVGAKAAKASDANRAYVFMSLALVVGVGEDSATVRLLSSPDDGSEDFVSPNHTSKTLTVGDAVWLMCWGQYTNSIIFLRNQVV